MKLKNVPNVYTNREFDKRHFILIDTKLKLFTLIEYKSKIENAQSDKLCWTHINFMKWTNGRMERKERTISEIKSNHEPDKSRNSLWSRLDRILLCKTLNFSLEFTEPLLAAVEYAQEFLVDNLASFSALLFLHFSPSICDAHALIENEKNTWKLNFEDAKECVISPKRLTVRFTNVDCTPTPVQRTHTQTHTDRAPLHRSKHFFCPPKTQNRYNCNTIVWFT